MKKINETGRVGLLTAWRDFFKGYFDFKGNTTRSAYWWGFLLQTIIMFIGDLFVANAYSMSFSAGSEAPIVKVLTGIGVVIVVAIILPIITLIVRRFRDVGLKPVSIVILLVLPVVIELILMSLHLFITLNNYGMMLNVYSILALIEQVFMIIDFVILLLPSKAMSITQTSRWVYSK